MWRRSLPHASTGGKERGDASGENRRVALLRRDSSDVHEKTRPDDSCDSSVKAGEERGGGGGRLGVHLGKNRLCRPITSAKSSIPFGRATKMEKNPRLTYTCSVTPPKPPLPKAPPFNAFKSGHPYGCGGSLHTDATFIPFLKFSYSTALTFLGPLWPAHRGLSRLTFCERSP